MLKVQRPALAAHEHETPVRRAIRLRLSPQVKNLSYAARSSIRRVATPTIVTRPMVTILDTEEAPLGVCRWVAWGKHPHVRAIRLALAMYLRRPTDLNNPGRAISDWDWRNDRERSAAERVFRRSPQYARLAHANILPQADKEHPVDPALWTVCWETTWPVLRQEVATIERTAFLAAVDELVKAREHRKSPTKKSEKKKLKNRKLTALQAAMLDAARTLVKGLEAGEDMQKLLEEQKAKTEARKKAKEKAT